MVYYNEIDPYAADWLRNLIQAGELPSGDVDERSIVEVQPDDLRPYTQCHFFAGLGGWLYALRLAGWPADEPVWTGSCPCQPFSAAGDRAGTADPRHLWPAFYRLIRECRPAAVFGEQVGSALGYRWLAGVRADVEQEGYAFAAADLPAACVGAPHIRQRLWFGAVRLEHASSERLANRAQIHQGQRRQGEAPPDEPRHTHRLADAGRGGVRSGSGSPDAYEASGETESQVEKRQLSRATARDCGPDGGMAYPDGWLESNADGSRGGREGTRQGTNAGGPGVRRGSWDNAVWTGCSDGKARKFEPGVHPLAHGVPARVGRLRAYGNAIVPQVAALFVSACIEATKEIR